MAEWSGVTEEDHATNPAGSRWMFMPDDCKWTYRPGVVPIDGMWYVCKPSDVDELDLEDAAYESIEAAMVACELIYG